MEKTTINLASDEIRDVIYGEADGFTLIESKVDGHWRHGSEEHAIVQRNSDKKFFRVNYRDSVKDTMEWSDMNEGGTFSEVFPIEKTITVYE